MIWKEIGRNIDLIIMGVVLVVVLILFLRDFDIKNKRSWFILLGLSALGAAIYYRFNKKSGIPEVFKKREEKLKEMEKNLEDLKNEGKISEESYQKAKEKLNESLKQDVQDSISNLNKYQENLKKWEEESKKTSPENLILELRKKPSQ